MGYSQCAMSRRIAIVEDDPAIRANYADALRKHGFEVSAYGARAEALAAMRARLPDLAVIDIGLGGTPMRASSCAASCAPSLPRCRSSFSRRATATSTSFPACGWGPTTTSPRT